MKLDELEEQARVARERLQQSRVELKQLRRSAGDLIRQQRAHATAVARLNTKRKARVAGMLFELFEKEGFFAEAKRLGFEEAQVPIMIEQSFARRRGLREAFLQTMERVAAALAKTPAPRSGAVGSPSADAPSSTCEAERASTENATASRLEKSAPILPDHLLNVPGDERR